MKPQYKFFDTVNKEFPENQNNYHIDNMGNIYEYVDGFSLKRRENIIAVPFTGFHSGQDEPIYEHDILRASKLNVKGAYKFKVIFEEGCFRLDGDDELYTMFDHYDDIKIMGSSLTTPELLENK